MLWQTALGIVFLLIGVGSAFSSAGRGAIPVWLFCLTVGALMLQHGIALSRIERRWRAVEQRLDELGAASPDFAEPDDDDDPTPLSEDEEMAQFLGIEVIDPPTHTPPD